MSSIPTVPLFDPNGNLGDIPQDQLAEAVKAGATPGVNITDPEGKPGVVPANRVAEAVKSGGKVVPFNLSPDTSGRVGVGSALWKDLTGFVAGLPTYASQMAGPTVIPGHIGMSSAAGNQTSSALQADASRKTAGNSMPYRAGALAATMTGTNVPAMEDAANQGDIGGVVGHALAVPAAMLATGAASRMAGEVGSAVGPLDPGRLVKTAGKVGVGALKDIPVVRQLTKVGKYYRETAPAPITDPEAINAKIQDIVRSNGKSVPAQSDVLGQADSKPAAETAPAPITDPEAINAKIQDIVRSNGKSVPAQSDVLGQADSKPAAETAAPQTAGSAEGSNGDTALFQRAKSELGDQATISQVAKKAQDYKLQGQEFEKIFDQPISRYQDAKGNFDMQGFLQEVVKPKTEPPAYVLSRTFGADGVKLIQDISGKPIAKWEQSVPKAERAAPAAPKKPEAATVAGDPRQYLNLVGANDADIMKTPEDVKTVNFFGNKYRNGQPFDAPEIHLDETNQVVGADGRHRALAAVKEGRQKMPITVKRHPFEAK